MVIHASADAIDLSQSLASRRQRPSHAKVRSTTQRRGRTVKAFAWSERLTISIVTDRLLPRRFRFEAGDQLLVVDKAVEEVVPFVG